MIQHVPGERDISHLLSIFPDAEVEVVRCEGNPMETFVAAMLATNDGALFLEDDAEFSSAFQCAHLDELQFRRDHALTLFRRDVREPGIYWLPGSKWLYNVAFWAPPGMGSAVTDYARTWRRRDEHPTGFDLIIRDWLVSRRYRFQAIYPCTR